jgi:hypothetical protein
MGTMHNKDVLATAAQVMITSNACCGYRTFENVTMDGEREKISFEIQSQFMESVFYICNLLNLTYAIRKVDGSTLHMEIH